MPLINADHLHAFCYTLRHLRAALLLHCINPKSACVQQHYGYAIFNCRHYRCSLLSFITYQNKK